MLNRLIAIMLLGAVLAAVAAENRPFRLPPGTVVTDTDERGGSWQENCVLAMSETATRKQLVQCLTAAHWKLDICVPPSVKGGATLMQWRRGKCKLIIMVWRIDYGKTGFSWGM